MQLDDGHVLDVKLTICLLALCVFIFTTWLALRSETPRAKRVAICLSVPSLCYLVYHACFVGVVN